MPYNSEIITDILLSNMLHAYFLIYIIHAVPKINMIKSLVTDIPQLFNSN